MKWLASLLCLVSTVGAQPTNAVRHFILDPANVTRLPIARDQLTTVSFPSPVSDLEGAFLSPEPEPPALFQISFRPGSHFFSLRALAANAQATLHVGWRGQTYILELIESSTPTLAAIFRPMPTNILATVPP